MARLEIRDVNKSYGPQHVLRDAGLTFAEGELVTLLGPSGCGKTTLLRIIAGLETADSGAVMLDGADISAMAPNRRNMGMVFQAYSLFPNMTAAENVAFGLKVRRTEGRRRAARVDDLMELVGLGAFRHKYPHQLSGGQQQRVALARALAISPSLLLLDEPLSALDARVRVQLRDEIRRIQQETGVTTIFVTHDQEEALSVSDRVAVMNHGRIDQFDTPQAIYQRPATAFVAGFIGISSRLEGHVAEGGVVLGSEVLPAPPDHGMTTGTQVTIYLRPEDVRLSPMVEGGRRGTVRAQTFMGAQTRVSVALPGGAEIHADLATPEAGALLPGTEVAVDWNMDRARILPRDRTAA
ncbi:ABC transporter ATP-binding protein [Acidimangrovimonas sediminis]|uniref:ABC transporter ATP-binding protein n=1 Tax=Acidimangrovimonas sediminis TaxID=2056283 RepID=UPI000C80113E|nr:ABC transporter ATP-binding protein [Acidimangrovimonas sediminis]